MQGGVYIQQAWTSFHMPRFKNCVTELHLFDAAPAPDKQFNVAAAAAPIEQAKL
jgi:hypothetical protein